MDLNGLTAVTTVAEMKAWLSANCLSPISPVMTGTDLGIIMQKVMDVTAAGSIGAAGNGLTLNGSEVDLGGTLNRQTTIDIATNMLQFLSSGGGNYSTTYQQRLQKDDSSNFVEAAIDILAQGPQGNSELNLTSGFMDVGYITIDGKQNMIEFSPDGMTFSSNDQPRANIDSDGIFHIDNLNVVNDLKVGGSINLPVTSVTTQGYTLTDTDYKILIRYMGAGDSHISLPDPTTVSGRVYVIQNINAAGVKFNYDITTSDGQTITANTPTLSSGDMTIELQSDGTVWTGITGAAGTTTAAFPSEITEYTAVKIDGGAGLMLGDANSETGVEILAGTDGRVASSLSGGNIDPAQNTQGEFYVASNAHILIDTKYIADDNVTQVHQSVNFGDNGNKMTVTDSLSRGLENAGDYSDYEIANDNALVSTKAVKRLIASNAPASSFATLSGAPADNTALAAALSAKADLSAGLIPFSELPNNIIDILYADLVTAMGASTLRKGQYYRITDFQTTHNIIGSSPTTLNTGAVEPLIVFAITASKLSPIAYSETWPLDIIYYTTANTAQSGASKGVILRRIDTVVNVDVCNDFRNVKYRRWALAPAAWSSSTAYSHGAVVQYTDGAVYFVNAQSGVSAGDIPSATSDNWAQLFLDNTQNYGRSTSNLLIGVNQVGSSVANPTVPNAGTFTDNYMFQGYDNTTAKYKDVSIGGDPGQLVNLVVYAYSGVTAVMTRVRIGQYAGGAFTTTFCVTAGSVGFQDIDLPQGINSCVLVVGALGMTNWTSPAMCFNSFFNITQFGSVQGGFGNSFIRGTMLFSSFNRLSFSITPNLVHNLRSNSIVGGYFCMSNASLKNVTIIGSGDVNYINTNDVLQQNQRGSGVWITSPLVNKIFFGLLSLDQAGTGAVQAVVTQSAINRAAYRKVIYIGEDQPSEKTVVKITSGSPLVVAWQTDLTPFNANNDYVSAGDSATISTYFSRHGNDFQVQQKDLISGVWTPNNSPAYTIDSVDGSGNITQVTLHPNTASGVTESRFIIV